MFAFIRFQFVPVIFYSIGKKKQHSTVYASVCAPALQNGCDSCCSAAHLAFKPHLPSRRGGVLAAAGSEAAVFVLSLSFQVSTPPGVAVSAGMKLSEAHVILSFKRVQVKSLDPHDGWADWKAVWLSTESPADQVAPFVSL